MPWATPLRIDPPNSFVLGGRCDPGQIPPPRVNLEGAEAEGADGFSSPATKNSPPQSTHRKRSGAGKGLRSPEILRRRDGSHGFALREGNREPRTNLQWQEDHLIDLVEQLQTWAAALDARETQLTAAAILDDHHLRQVRLETLRRESFVAVASGRRSLGQGDPAKA